MEKGLVSCIIPTYKRSDMLPRAIDSVLNQTYKNIEILVVDDNVPGSKETEDVRCIVEQYIESGRVHYVGQKEHINGAVARNVGIHKSEAEFIAFLDDDEEWEPDKVEKQVLYLTQHEDVDGVSCLYANYKSGKIVAKIAPYSADDLQLKVLTGQVAIHTSTFLCRRNKILQSGAFHPDLLRHQDIQMFTDFLDVGTIHPICEYLVKNHIDSEINRPNVERLIQVKKDFLNAISQTLDRFNKKDRVRIHNAHAFEIIFCALKQKKYFVGLKWLLKCKISLQSLKDLKNRWRNRDVKY